MFTPTALAAAALAALAYGAWATRDPHADPTVHATDRIRKVLTVAATTVHLHRTTGPWRHATLAVLAAAVTLTVAAGTRARAVPDGTTGHTEPDRKTPDRMFNAAQALHALVTVLLEVRP